MSMESDNTRSLTASNVAASAALAINHTMKYVYSPGNHAAGETSFTGNVTEVTWSRNGVKVTMANGQSFLLAVAEVF